MKIAIFHELHRGGARRSVNEVAKRLKKSHTIDLYIVDEKKEKEEGAYFNSIHFFPFRPKKWTGRNWKVRIYKDTIELLKLYFLHKRIAKEINQKNYDAALIHPSQFTQAPFILQFINGVKIYYCHEPLRLVYDPLLNIKNEQNVNILYETTIRKVRKYIDKKNTFYATKILTNSQFTTANVKKSYGLASQPCYHGVDSSVFKPSHKARDIDILFIGTDSILEGSDLFNKMKKDLSSRYKVVQLDNTKQWVSEKKLINYYQQSKIVLCLSRNEPFGMIPLEAGACGCVTIAINEGGYKESIKDGFSGFLVKPESETIIKKIKYLLLHPYTMEKISHTARELMVKEWSWNEAAKKITRIIQDVVNKK